MKALYIAFRSYTITKNMEYPMIRAPKCPMKRSYCSIRLRSLDHMNCKYFEDPHQSVILSFQKPRFNKFYQLDIKCTCSTVPNYIKSLE